MLSLKASEGFVGYGQYFLGNNREVAYNLFNRMQGSKKLDDALLHIDLMETVNELPVKIEGICCTLEQLGINCKLIAREVFRLKNLEDMV